MNKELPIYLWLWLPIAWLIGQFLLEFTASQNMILNIHAEGNIHELIQFGLLVTSFILCCIILLKMKCKNNPWLTAWITLAALSCFYVGVEEVSWGQSFFNWHTPEEWQGINSQNETNLHNTSRLLNHIPRYILMTGIAVGGLIIPFIMWFKPSLLPQKFNLIYPPIILSVTALCLLVIGGSNKLYKMILDEKLFERASEIEEIFMFFFVFLYIIILKKRILN